MDSILESFLSTILKDIINAQNKANIYSAKISEEYVGNNTKHELLKFFEIPSVRVKSFDFDLKFGLEKSEGIIGNNISDALSSLINISIHKFINVCMETYNLPIGIEKKIEELISYSWSGKDISTILIQDENDLLIEDIKKFVKELKININNFTNQKIIPKNFEKELHGLKAIFSVNELDSFNQNILCSMHITAEIIGKKPCFISEYDSADEENIIHKPFLVNT